MPRRNYINKKRYKEQKRKLEEQTKGFVNRMNKKMGLAPKKHRV